MAKTRPGLRPLFPPYSLIWLVYSSVSTPVQVVYRGPVWTEVCVKHEIQTMDGTTQHYMRMFLFATKEQAVAYIRNRLLDELESNMDERDSLISEITRIKEELEGLEDFEKSNN